MRTYLRRAVTFVCFGQALLSPVEYIHATADHNWHMQLLVMASGPLFLWWGVVGVIRFVQEDDKKASDKP